jgi:hypothetical protein
MDAIGIPSEELLPFVHALEHARPRTETIDAYLEGHPRFRRAGAACIAAVILDRERSSILARQDWYATLYDLLCLKDPDAAPPFSGIVTFNYDRSLEYWLLETAEVTVPEPRHRESIEKLLAIPVCHVHQSLGPFPEFPFDADVKEMAGAIKSAAQSIRITGDDLSASPDYVAARQLIEQASKVVFIGFNFDERNMQELMQGITIRPAKFFATVPRPKQPWLNRVKLLMNNMICIHPSTADEFMRNVDTKLNKWDPAGG